MKNLESLIQVSAERISALAAVLGDRFQNAYSENGFYTGIPNNYWTTGFWTGQLWLARELTGNRQFQLAAEKQVDSFLDRITRRIEVDHHDMGFLYSLSCVAAWKLTGNEKGKKAALMAADKLLERFHPEGNYIQAWGAMSDPDRFMLIIDSLMNTPLLHWASSVTGEEKYERIAVLHTETVLEHVIRDDFSTWHTYFFHPDGSPSRGATCQGYRDGSAWTRGQAWGIYGSILSYRFLKKEEYLELFRKLSAYYEAHLPEDLVPYWDLEFNSGDSEPRDSSSAAIVACAYLEAALWLPKEEASRYQKRAKEFLTALADKCFSNDKTQSNGLLLHGTYSNQTAFNTCDHKGVDECTSWGDYFFMEALRRLKDDNWNAYWYSQGTCHD